MNFCHDPSSSGWAPACGPGLAIRRLSAPASSDRQPEPDAHRDLEDADVRVVGEPLGRKRGEGIEPVAGHPVRDRPDALIDDQLLVDGGCHR
jgi:hypothetical protein